jgi:hypothetical protein
MIWARYWRFRAALLRRSLMLRLSPTALIMLKAKCRTVAMLAGPCPVRDRALSSLKVTSSTQCRLWRVGRRDCTTGLSQNGAGASRLTPLPSSKRACHPALPVHEQIRLLHRYLFEEAAGPRLVPLQPPIFPHRPGHQRFVDVPEDRIQSRWIEPPIIGSSASIDYVRRM